MNRAQHWARIIDALPESEERKLTQKKQRRYLPWIFQKIKKRLPAILFLTMLNIAVCFANIQFALVTKSVVNSAIARDLEQLKLAALVMIGLSMFRLAGNVLYQFLSVNVNEGLERDFKRAMLHVILRSDYSRISTHHSGDLIQRMDGDSATVISGVMEFTSGITGIVTSLFAAVIALLQIAPGFTIVCGCIMVLMSMTALLFRRTLKQLNKDTSAANGRVRGYLHESISKLMVIQALDVGAEMEVRCDQVLDDRWAVRRKWRNVSILSRLGTNSINYVSYLATMLWCAWKLLSGAITYGDVTAITSLFATARSSATSLPRMLPQIFSVTAACDRLMELEDIPQQSVPDPEKVRAMYAGLKGFVAEHLTFSYDREPVLTDVCLTIPKGGLTVIIGQSGIGKSTLLKLLLGLYRPQSGALWIDAADGRVPVDRSTRSLFSYAPQGNFLLSGTLRENLTYTNPQATDEQIREALYVSAMDEYVASLPQGLETVLLENGAGLSEGQAQRISLARAILSGAPVLLLDEVTSALDALTEKTVLERICALPGKTCIAVTHRPAALALADQIIEVTEEGMTFKKCE